MSIMSLGGGGGGGGGQSFEDKLYALKYFISGQAISLVVLKATTSELMGPKKKHLNYLLSMTNESNVSIPNLTKYLMQRAKHPDWSVSFKSLITIHHLMSYGNERFIQNLASSSNVNNRSFSLLASYVDRSSNQAYDMSTFLRRYSLYINAKISTYRSLGLDFCRLIIANNKSTKLEIQPQAQTRTQTTCRLREMPLEQLMIILPILQEQFDSLIAFDASPNDLNNGIINTAFSSLYKDFVKLYLAYQTVILRLLELYFMITQLKRAQELYDAYRRFLVRMDKVSDFMRTIDSVGMDKSDLPNMSKAPSLSLQLLENHLKQLDPSANSKRTTSADPTGKWKPIELPSTLQYGTLGGTSAVARRRGSSSGGGALNQPRAASAIGQLAMATPQPPTPGFSAAQQTPVPGSVPRLKSPDIQRKHRRDRKFRPPVAATATATCTSNKTTDFPWTVTTSTTSAIAPFSELGEKSLENSPAVMEAKVTSNTTSDDPRPLSPQHEALDREDDFDLLLDVDEQQPEPPEPELIILNHDDREVHHPRVAGDTKQQSSSLGFIAINGGQKPSDWVQV